MRKKLPVFAQMGEFYKMVSITPRLSGGGFELYFL